MGIDLRKSGKARLAAVLRAAGDVVRIEDAETALGVSRIKAAKVLSRWARQGWLRRSGRGVYVPVSLESFGSERVLDDPWILVPVLFHPAYVGGRTATEYWDLTEQIFQDIVVFTARPIRRRSVEHHDFTFTLKQIQESAIFGTKVVWRGRTKIYVSDVHRTVIDILDDPTLGGGIQHVSECFAEYVQRSDRNFARLVEYADLLGNGAIFKRLGFLAERLGCSDSIVALSSERLTKGYAKLDPSQDCPRIVTRWRLRVPETWKDIQ